MKLSVFGETENKQVDKGYYVVFASSTSEMICPGSRWNLPATWALGLSSAQEIWRGAQVPHSGLWVEVHSGSVKDDLDFSVLSLSLCSSPKILEWPGNHFELQYPVLHPHPHPKFPAQVHTHAATLARSCIPPVPSVSLHRHSIQAGKFMTCPTEADNLWSWTPAFCHSGAWINLFQVYFNFCVSQIGLMCFILLQLCKRKGMCCFRKSEGKVPLTLMISPLKRSVLRVIDTLPSVPSEETNEMSEAAQTPLDPWVKRRGVSVRGRIIGWNVDVLVNKWRRFNDLIYFNIYQEAKEDNLS